MTLREEFEGDIEKFLATHAISIEADQHTHGNDLQNALPFNRKDGNDVASLTAPSGFVDFILDKPKSVHPILTCGVPEVTMRLTSDNTKLPVYVIPYKGTKGFGVKLPSGNGVAYAITTKINGCTMSVSGTRQSPYASHSNVWGGKQDTKSQRMESHVLELERLFREEEVNSGDGTGQSVGTNRTHFNHFYNPGQRNGRQFVNYVENMQQSVSNATQRGAAHFRREGFGCHKKYVVRVSENSLSGLMGPKAMNDSAVVGKRENGVWTFYYSSHVHLSFDIQKTKKCGASRSRGRIAAGFPRA